MFQRFLRALVWVSAAAAVMHGCSCEGPTTIANSKVPEHCEDSPQPLVAQKTDILFVIDNSGSMKEEQEAVAKELPAFVSELKNGGGLDQDFQVGVVTTSVYERGELNGRIQTKTYPLQAGLLQEVPPAVDGGAPSGEKILVQSDPGLIEKFSRLVKQGTAGSGQETPFEAARLAAELAMAPDGGNSGFLRDGARLLVVVVSDEDDCSEMHRPAVVALGGDSSRDYCTEQSVSLTPVGEYYTAFQRLTDRTGARRDILWSAIAPVSLNGKQAQEVTEAFDGGVVTHNVDCPSSNGPGYRQREMTYLFDNSLENLASICSGSYRDTLVSIARIAAENQTVELSQNIPDPGLIVIDLERKNGSVQKCTVGNNGFTFEPATNGRKARVHFTGGCVHRLDDRTIQVRLLCAG